MAEKNIYQENGFENRNDYLRDLANSNGISEDAVFAIADVYGPGEDFDGTVTEVQDLASGNSMFSGMFGAE